MIYSKCDTCYCCNCANDCQYPEDCIFFFAPDYLEDFEEDFDDDFDDYFEDEEE